MKERPILFSGPMVRALLAGTKTQTRRIVRGLTPESVNVRTLFGYVKCDAPEGADRVSDRIPCPYGWTEDRLWVRETWAQTDARLAQRLGPVLYRADGALQPTEGGRWRPSIFMPRALSRITLEVVSVRVERLQDITDEDIAAEGVTLEAVLEMVKRPVFAEHTVREAWHLGWDIINGKRAPWASNPWVWRIEFKRLP